MLTVLYILLVIAFLWVLVDVWRSPMTYAKKAAWSIFALLFSLVTLIVWLVWGRGEAYRDHSMA